MNEDVVQLYYRCGANLSDHGDLGSNGFCLYRGSDPIIGMARIKAHSGTERESKYCNVLTVDGYGQWQGRPGTSVLEAHEDTPVYTYLRGEAADPYVIPSSSQHLPLLESWKREILFHKELQWLVILDRVRKVKEASVVTLHTQLQAAPVASAGGYDVRVGDTWMVCHSILPAPAVATTEPLLLGPRPGTGSPTSWRRNDIGPAGKENVFLNVYRIGAPAILTLPVLLSGDRLTIGTTQVALLPTLSLVQAPPVPVLTLKDAADAFDQLTKDYEDITDAFEKTTGDILDTFARNSLVLSDLTKKFRKASGG